jgi:hypothetical protein
MTYETVGAPGLKRMRPARFVAAILRGAKMTTSIDFISHSPETFRITPDLTFDKAADPIRSRTVDSLGPAMAQSSRRNRTFQNGYIRPRTLRCYEQYTASLGLFFYGRILSSITAPDFRRYQATSLAGAAPFIRKRRADCGFHRWQRNTSTFKSACLTCLVL